MRKIKFRGKGIYNVEWYYGDLLQNDNSGHCYIVFNFVEQNYIDYSQFVQAVQVDPNTVGQFTGLYDKNGVEIYEGDVVEYNDEIKIKGIVKWIEDEALFSIHWESGKYGLFVGEDMSLYEVIGNIHEEMKE